jgi:vitamin B12 transporter
MPVTPIIDTDQIVITASRAPGPADQTPASVSVIDAQRIERLGEPLLPALLRLTPSAAISTSGPAGSFTEVRIRGAEVNHTLLLIDGIRVNDPATGDFPRFELLNADLASRIEVIRGPQSAIWGSEAIGGVIAVNGVAEPGGHSAAVEAGSFGFVRGAASAALVHGESDVAGAVGWQRATGIDSFDEQGERDGYRNLSARLRGSWRPAPWIAVGGAVLALTGRTQFDGFDPVTFARTDTLDSSRNRLAAGRLVASLGSRASPWSGELSASLLGSSNRNFLDEEQINRTRGTRRSVTAQLERRLVTGPVTHRLIAAAELERETFRARDIIYGGFSNQDRSRRHQSLTFEWRGEAGRFTGDLAVRRDWFNRFDDATSVRASLLARVGGGFSIAGSYGEGIAQPTFFDLYGFFPNTFLGNPSLKPESSRGFEGSLRFRRGAMAASLTAYRQRLHDEVVDVFDFGSGRFSTANRAETSRRSGVEADVSWSVTEALRLSGTYAYLRATQPDSAGLTEVRELRRPEHSASVALDGTHARLTYGASLAYVGRHSDQRDTFPFDRVTLGSYWLAGARVAYALRPRVELFARGSNLLDEDYQDVFGYRTEGRALYLGVRLADRRSSR